MENKKALPVILLNMAVDIHNERECEILISQYAQRVCDAGAVPMLMPSIENEDMIETLLDLADGVLCRHQAGSLVRQHRFVRGFAET